MTDLGEYEATIDEAGGYVYYAFTPEESGTYRFYTTGDYDTYAYIYDADWNELDSDDDSGSDTNAKIAISLEAGNTYYIAIRFYSSNTTGSFSVCAEKVLAAVSAELVLSEDLTLYEGIDSYTEYDDDDEAFEYYDYYELNFTSGDQIVLTLEDGSTVTCTSYGSVYFYGEDDNRLSFSCSSDQYSEHWEVGNTYYFTYTVTDYAIDVQIPVTIAENPYADATVEFVSEDVLTLYEGIDSYTDYDDDDEEFEYYSFWNLNFSSSDQIVITCSDGSTITYTADGYGDFYDEDDNSLSFSCSSDQYSEPWEVGGTYYFTLTLSDYGLTVQIPVTIAENPYADDSDSSISGTSGTCAWTIENGVLTIAPADGESGQLDMSSHEGPWQDYSEYVTVIVIEPGVKANSSSAYLFAGLCNATAIEGIENLDVSQICDGGAMFYGCSSITSIDLSSWDTSGFESFGNMFDGCSSLVSVDISGLDTSGITNTGAMFQGCSSITLEDIKGLDSFDVSAVTSMPSMFAGCSSITNLDALKNWDISNAANIAGIFNGCSSITSLEAIEDWNTSNVTAMDSSFSFCSSLTDITAIENWDVSNVTSFWGTFYGCSSLRSANLSAWDVSSITRLEMIFAECASLETADLSGWDLSNTTRLENLFQNCTSLKSVDFSNWNTSNITHISAVFIGCSSLISLDLSSWDTSNVENIYSLFDGCTSLASLDLSSWDTSNVSDALYVFDGCGGLRKVVVGDGFVFRDGMYLPWPVDGNDYGYWQDDKGNVYEVPSYIPSNTAATYTAVFELSQNQNTINSGSGTSSGNSGSIKTQKITVKKSQLTKTIHTKKLKKKKQTFKLKASTSGNGKITYKKTSGNKKIKVSKTGKVTVKKGLKKGKTYKVKVKITAAKTSKYKKTTKTVTLKIKIK